MINISPDNEFDIDRQLREPHFSYIDDNVLNKKKVSFLILSKDNSRILLVDSYGFIFDSIFTGLSEKHIEHIAKNGPKDYKENILKILKDKEMMQGVFEIAKAMDEDLGGGSTRHQTRVKNVIQYIKDNQVVFEF